VETLQQIAAFTGAGYLPASGPTGLKSIFQDAQLQAILVNENVEAAVAFLSWECYVPHFRFS